MDSIKRAATDVRLALTRYNIAIDRLAAVDGPAASKRPRLWPSIDLVKAVVSRHYGIPVSDLESAMRPERIAFPRQVAMRMCRKLTRYSLAQIGLAFGGRDHGTVMWACRAVDNRRDLDAAFAAELDALEERTGAILRELGPAGVILGDPDKLVSDQVGISPVALPA